ncbi:hypothetical protein [Anthocerotibacter panamensis]|uniref:hypothetical protein n=1 Tax=Anthocerotibacter panamensis TaxID=2857077 RepID=UPI001C4033C8|nr:hypothetical protein [Anthocerotibacter panamensis]
MESDQILQVKVLDEMDNGSTDLLDKAADPALDQEGQTHGVVQFDQSPNLQGYGEKGWDKLPLLFL